VQAADVAPCIYRGGFLVLFCIMPHYPSHILHMCLKSAAPAYPLCIKSRWGWA
jgi:hypothetical protein